VDRRRREYPGLGTIPDPDVARALGLHPSTVAHARLDRGIPSPRPRGRPASTMGRTIPQGIPATGGALRALRLGAALTMGRLGCLLVRPGGAAWTAASVSWWEAHPDKLLPWDAILAVQDAIVRGDLSP